MPPSSYPTLNAPDLTDPNLTRPTTVAIAGGGLAGLAAGCALAEAGFRVSLFERRPYLGGRASSYQHPGTGEVVDNCQHVLLGCCTNLLDFYRRARVQDKIRWYDKLTFLEPGGRASVIAPSSLPAPLHTALSFLRADCLSFRDKLSISRAMAALTPSSPPDRGESFLDWLKRHGQTAQAIDRFWKTILVSALNEIRALGGEIQLRAGIESFQPEASGVSVTANGQQRQFDYLLLAVPFDALERLLPDTESAKPLAAELAKFSTSPITGIHLWFDRQISDLDHAVLLDRTIQWMFHKSRLIDARDKNKENGCSYIELVVSCSRSLVEKSKPEIVEMAVKEVEEFFPGARGAKLVKSTVIKEVHATYSARPGVDQYRPKSVTAWPRVFLAGDYTATGWPATMEGAVRSGYLAAEALARFSGAAGVKFLVSELPASGLMKLFG